VLLERYVPGEEVAVEGILSDRALSVLAVFDKPDPLVGPYFEETIYVTPSRHPTKLLAEVERVTAAACRALGLAEGPIHAELRLPGAAPVGTGPPLAGPLAGPPGGLPPAPGAGAVLLEVAARSIGGLCSRTLSFGTGLSLEEVVLAHALSRPVGELRRSEGAAGVMMLPIPASGVLRAVRGQEEARAVPGIVGLELTALPGRMVQALPEGDRYLGFLLARGPRPEGVEAALREAFGALEVVVDPDGTSRPVA
jgi:biotin carboxylase